MTNTHHIHHNNRPSIWYTLAISLTTTLFIISVQHLMLVTKQPTYTQMDEMTNQAQGSFLRNHPPPSRPLVPPQSQLGAHNARLPVSWANTTANFYKAQNSHSKIVATVPPL